MKRISTPTATDDHKFRDGDGQGLKATQFNAEWCNQVQEEICALIKKWTGMEPNGLSDHELATAFENLKSLRLVDDAESDYRTEFFVDTDGNSNKGYGAKLEIAKQYDESTIKKLSIVLALVGNGLSKISFDGELEPDDVKTPIVKSVDNVDGAEQVTGYQISDNLLMLARLFNNQGSQAYRKFRLKWDNSAGRFNLDYDGDMNVNDFMYILDNKIVVISPLYNPATGATNINGIVLVWDNVNNRFDARIDGDVTVNGKLNGLMDLDALIVSPSNDNWQKSSEWTNAGQSKRVLNNTASDMSVTYFPSSKNNNGWQVESSTNIITIPPHHYRTFTWTGATRTVESNTIAGFLVE